MHSTTRFRRTGILFLFASAAALPLLLASAREGQSKFLRFIDEGTDKGRLETSIVTYEDERGVRVSLVAAVHVADAAYYEKLQSEFETYDALLYEMVKDKDVDPEDPRGGGGLLGAFQRLLKTALALEFQLDGIDYSRENFVHADMDPETFARMQRERGESLLSLMFKAWKEEWKRQAAGESSGPTLFDLIRVVTSDDGSRTLKYIFARQMEDMEKTLAGIEGEEGSVIVAERNKVALEVLEKRIAAGDKKLAIFYGAAHMPDMEKRLEEMGFRAAGKPRWLTAWDIGGSEPVEEEPPRRRIRYTPDAPERPRF